MALIVQKFGGSSVADRDRIFNVARIVANTHAAGNDVVVVVSAQGDTTDDLIAKAGEITHDPSQREMDMLLATGEQISISLLAMALGGRTKKLKYGHHGSNHPVKDLKKDRVYITSQNHGYAVDDEHLPQGAVVSHRSWNDQTVEGLVYPELKAFTVQYHPEASPGPKDTGYLFDEFLDMIRENQ